MARTIQRQWSVASLVMAALALMLAIACRRQANYFINVTNRREIAVIVRAGTSETLFERLLAPGETLTFDATDFASHLRVGYFVSIEPESGPDARSLCVSFSAAEVVANDESNPVTILVASDHVKVNGLNLDKKLDGAIIANDLNSSLTVGGDAEADVTSSARVGLPLNPSSKTVLINIGKDASVELERNTSSDSSFGQPLGIRQGPEGTSVVLGYYFQEEWFRPGVLPGKLYDPQHPLNRNKRVQEVGEVILRYFREHGELPSHDGVTLPDFAIVGEEYSWEEGCFLRTRTQESAQWFHFRVIQHVTGHEPHWICKQVWLGN